MSDYAIGDWVLIRGQVTAVFGSDIGYAVELFSKTDQYAAHVRPDLVIQKTAPPIQPEPDREYLIRDSDGDVWRWSARQLAWECRGVIRGWESLCRDYGPLKIYGEI